VQTGNVTRSATFTELNGASFGKTQQTIGSLSVSYDVGETTLKSISAFIKTEDSFLNDFSGSGAILAAQQMAVDQYSQELQLIGKSLGGRLRYLFGAYAFEESGDQDFAWFWIVPLNRSVIDAKTISFSIFAQADFLFTDNLKGTAGIRYTKDEKSFDFGYEGVYGLPWSAIFGPPPSGTVTFDNEYTETTPRVALDYSVPTLGENIDSVLLYASAAKGFKSGGYNGIAIFSFNDAKSAYAPESNWTYEVGVKTDLLSNRLRVNANYFLAKAKDLALNATVGIGAFPVQNSGTATIKGLETEITAIPADGLTVFISGTFLMDGSYDSFRAGSAPANAPIIYKASAVVPQTPNYSFTAGFEYSLDTAFGRTTFGADWFQTDDYITAATNDYKVKGYGQGNAFVAVGFGERWSARASVKNFTDEYVLQTGSRALGGFISLRPREYLFSVNYSMN
jgi:iron complex outermembrane receptor protein